MDSRDEIMKLEISGYMLLGVFVVFALFGLFSGSNNYIYILYSIPLGVTGSVFLSLLELRKLSKCNKSSVVTL